MGHTDCSLTAFGLPPECRSAPRLLEIADALPSLDYPTFQRYVDTIGFSVREKKHRDDFNPEIEQIRKAPKPSLDEIHHRLRQLNDDQRRAFDIIKPFLDGPSTAGATFHIDASAGCGKTYFANFLADYARVGQHIVLSVATTGIAALHYRDGRTGHSMFAIPIDEMIDVLDGPSLSSTLLAGALSGKLNNRLQLLKEARLIFWDEISMLNNKVLSAVNTLLKAVMGSDQLFGGKIFVTLGDWKQLPPVDADSEVRVLDPDLITSANSSYKLSVLSLPFWKQFRVCRFFINERQKYDPGLHSFLTDVGNGKTGTKIPLDALPPGIRITHSIDEALHWLYYGEDQVPPFDPFACEHIHARAFLAPYNADIDHVNDLCEVRLRNLYPESPFVSLRSADSFQANDDQPSSSLADNPSHFLPSDVVDRNARFGDHLNDIELQYVRDRFPETESLDGGLDISLPVLDDGHVFDYSTGLQNERLDSSSLAVEHLNSIRFPGCPNHRINITEGSIVMLMRNMDPSRRMLNGQRFIVKHIHPNRRLLSIVPADRAGDPDAPAYLLPRIVFKCKFSRRQDAIVQRKQFPIRICYAVTIHKSQASTLQRVVVDLRSGVFDHGQLYVALSRVRKASDLMILLRPDQTELRNIVIRILLGE
jgi:hypothetical protein